MLCIFPEHKGIVKKVRKDPRLSNVIKVAELVMSSEEISELVGLGIYGPYRYLTHGND